MKIYRCCGDEEFNSYKNGEKYLKTFGRGTNTFNYSDQNNYIHFLLFAESMFHYSKHERGRFTKHFIECDIPFETLKKYYGYGWYEAIIPGYYIPVPEFAIPFNEFDINSICDTSDEQKTEWLRSAEWQQYIQNIPEEYVADYETGSFRPGYNERSILEIPVENLIGHITGKTL